MNTIVTVTLILFLSVLANGQTITSVVNVVTHYSQNNLYYLISKPYDNEIPSLRGKTTVFETGSNTPIYELDRSFDLMGNEDNTLILSNDGRVIFYAVTWRADEKSDGLRSVNFYQNGTLVKSYSKTEITGCELDKERCELVYYDDEKKDIDEKEKFLNKFAIFSFDDTVYITDSKRKTHFFSLKEKSYFGSDDFDNIYKTLKEKGRIGKTNFQRFPVPIYPGFPKLQDGRKTEQNLATNLEMKSASIVGTKDDAFKIYRAVITAYILKDGEVELEKVETDEELPKDKIIEFFKSNKFDSAYFPGVFEKWYTGDTYFYFRKSSNKLAREEKQKEIIERREARDKNIVAEKINDVYIPKDLGDALGELDKILKDVDKSEMKALGSRDEMIRYHMGLGMWLRNNWGLWGGSRLQKYFNDNGIAHPDDMSGIVLNYYYDWLTGNEKAWKQWRKNTVK